jgi:hypothetical protein
MNRLEVLKNISTKKRKFENELRVLSEILSEQNTLKAKITIYEEIFASKKNPVLHMLDHLNIDDPNFIYVLKKRFIEEFKREDFSSLSPSIQNGIKHKRPGVRFVYGEFLIELIKDKSLVDEEFDKISELIRTISKDKVEDVSGRAQICLRIMIKNHSDRMIQEVESLSSSKKVKERFLAVIGAEELYLSGKKEKGLELLRELLHDENETNRICALSAFREIARKIKPPVFDDYNILFSELAGYVQQSNDEQMQNDVIEEIGFMAFYNPEKEVLALATSLYDRLLPFVGKNEWISVRLSSGVNKLHQAILQYKPDMVKDIKEAVIRWREQLKGTDDYEKFVARTNHIFSSAPSR